MSATPIISGLGGTHSLENPEGQINRLPDELMVRIFLLLPYREFTAAKCTCRRWRRIGGDHQLERARISGQILGKADWKKCFGEVGQEPPLPQGIERLLQSSCPFWPGKRVEETHIFVLLPQTVNGAPLTLNLLDQFTKFGHYFKNIKREYGNQHLDRSYWILMTKDVLPESRNKCWEEQCALMQAPYSPPEVLEATAGMALPYVKDGQRLWAASSPTYTRCSEVLLKAFFAVVGGSAVKDLFTAEGLVVNATCSDGEEYGMIAVRRFFLNTSGEGANKPPSR